MAINRWKVMIGVLICVTLGLCGLVLIFGNPFNIAVQSSDKFTVAKFLSIGEGDTIAEVMELLGEPIRVERADPSDCKDCTFYYFEGNPARWLVAYREAWVLVGPDGIVKQRILHSEP
jgi:hypothetical protein